MYDACMLVCLYVYNVLYTSTSILQYYLKETDGMDEINLLFLIVPVVKFSE